MITKRTMVYAGVALAVAASALLLRTQLPRLSLAATLQAKASLRAELPSAPKAEHQALFTQYLGRLDADGILDVLEQSYKLCHSQAHPLGMAIFEQTRDVQQSIAACRDRCTNGCFHGVLMAAFKGYAQPASFDPEGHIEFDQLVAHANLICDDPKTAATHRRGNCAHGIGHALSFLSGYRLADATAACRLFGEKPLQYYCASGVYMERDIVHGRADAQLTPRLSPCDQEADFPAACYRYKVKHLLNGVGTNEQVADLCLGMAGLQRLGCFHGLGFTYLDTVSSHPDALRDVCRFGTPDDQKICIEGAIEKLADYDERRANAACASLTPELKSHCLQAVRYGLYSLEKPFVLYFAEGP